MKTLHSKNMVNFDLHLVLWILFQYSIRDLICGRLRGQGLDIWHRTARHIKQMGVAPLLKHRPNFKACGRFWVWILLLLGTPN